MYSGNLACSPLVRRRSAMQQERKKERCIRRVWPFQGTALPSVEFSQMVGVDLHGQVPTTSYGDVIALVGRDILSRCVMIYHGLRAFFTVAF